MSESAPLQNGPVQARVLRIFISYAREDERLALTVVKSLNDLLGGSGLCQVTFDKYSFEAGAKIKQQIKSKLEETDFLVIIYTGVEKPAHSYTGWEIGYFEGIMLRENERDIPRKIVSFFLHTPPTVNEDTLGIKLDITRDDLMATEQNFKTKLAHTVDEHHSVVTFLTGLQQIVEREGEALGLSPIRQDAKSCAHALLLGIFENLKNTVDKILKPQKQIIVRTVAGTLGAGDSNLPGSARLTPVGSGNSMEVFGLPNEEITWSEFEQKVWSHKFGSSWCEAITSVIISSLPNPLEIDNSQMLVASDEGHFYRLILTTGANYYNGNREFNLYLVEALRLEDYGNQDTTRLLNGLKIVCLFRFMFLEVESEFSPYNLLLTPPDEVAGIVRDLLKALNRLRQAGEQAGLHRPAIWVRFVKWEVITEMVTNWQPLEEKLRELAGSILLLERNKACRNEIIALRADLAQVFAKVAESTRKQNQTLFEQMTAKLLEVIKSAPLAS